MLAIPAGTWLTVRDGQHRLHADHHARFQHRVDILAQFQPGLAAIIVPQQTVWLRYLLIKVIEKAEGTQAVK